MTNLIIKSSRLKYLLFLFAGLGFVAGGVFILRYGKPSDYWIGLMSIIFFGSCSLIFIWQIFDRRPRLVINEQGVLDRTLGVGMIPWPEIANAHLKSIKNNDFICLELKNPKPWLEKLSPVKRVMVSANKALGFSEFNLNLSGIDANSDEIFELVIKMISIQKG